MRVTQIGRLQWYVDSETREEMVHLVDFEPNTYTFYKLIDEELGLFEAREVEEATFCSCEAWNMLKHRPCKHQREVIYWLANSIPLTGEQREEMTAKLEALCRQPPHWIHPAPAKPTPEPEKQSSSFQTKRQYVLHRR